MERSAASDGNPALNERRENVWRERQIAIISVRQGSLWKGGKRRRKSGKMMKRRRRMRRDCVSPMEGKEEGKATRIDLTEDNVTRIVW